MRAVFLRENRKGFEVEINKSKNAVATRVSIKKNEIITAESLSLFLPFPIIHKAYDNGMKSKN